MRVAQVSTKSGGQEGAEGLEKREDQRHWMSPNCHANACGVAMRMGD